MDSEKIIGLSPIIDPKAKFLILGSMPGVESLQKEQYYANGRNHFWRIMARILNEKELANYAERVSLLQKNHIALWDVIRTCKREGSLDSAISEEIPNNFDSLFKQYSSIDIVGFNGNKAYNTFKMLVGFHSFPEIQFIKLPSTSPTPGRNVKTFEEKIVEWEKLTKR